MVMPIRLKPFGLSGVSIWYINYSRSLSKVFLYPTELLLHFDISMWHNFPKLSFTNAKNFSISPYMSPEETHSLYNSTHDIYVYSF